MTVLSEPAPLRFPVDPLENFDPRRDRGRCLSRQQLHREYECNGAHAILDTTAARRGFRNYFSATQGLVNSPMPSIQTVIVSPGFSHRGGLRPKPTPGGVPVETTSPGSNVNNFSVVGGPNLQMQPFGPGAESGIFEYFTEAVNGSARSSRT